MKYISRWLINFFLVILLLLWTVVLSARFFTVNNNIIGAFHLGNRLIYIDVFSQTMRIDAIEGALPNDPTHWSFPTLQYQDTLIFSEPTTPHFRQHFGWYAESGQKAATAVGAPGWIAPLRQYNGIFLPLPSVMYLLIAISIPSVALFVHRQYQKRKRLIYITQNRCQSCGYDLRATPTRCPECGTPTSHEKFRTES